MKESGGFSTGGDGSCCDFQTQKEIAGDLLRGTEVHTSVVTRDGCLSCTSSGRPNLEGNHNYGGGLADFGLRVSPHPAKGCMGQLLVR